MGIVAAGLLFVVLVAWVVFPASQKTLDSVNETNPTKKRSLGEIILRDFLGIPKCGILGGGCGESPSAGDVVGDSPDNASFSHLNIKVITPSSSSMVSSGQEVNGLARTSWFLQGIASGEVRNEKNQKIGAFTIKTDSTSKDGSFVRFKGTLLYNDPKTKTGYLVFNKAQSANSNQLTKEPPLWVAVLFKETSVSDNQGGILNPGKPPLECRKTGCSGQICADREVVTTCEYVEEYSCYQAARCERQQNGECGFTRTQELNSCLSKSKNGI